MSSGIQLGNKPSKCKWCGAGVAKLWLECSVDFTCGSTFWVEDCTWTCDDACADGLRNRIERSIEMLKTAVRQDFIVGYLSYMEQRSDGEFIEYEQAEQVIEILKGEADDESDGMAETDILAAWKR